MEILSLAGSGEQLWAEESSGHSPFEGRAEKHGDLQLTP
jgi:hypothetical protein